MIKCVFFDVDDTLFDSTGLTEKARRAAIDAMIEVGLSVTPENGYELLMEIVKKYGSNYGKHFDALLDEFKMEWNPMIIAAGVYAYHRIKFAYLRPFPEVIPSLIELKKRDLKLGIVSDGDSIKQWDKIIRLGLQNFFDVVVTSEETGAEKPDSKIYEVALEKSKCKPKNSLMVGDRIIKDIFGAKRVGMLTVRFLHGKYKEEKPHSEEETPDFQIKRFRELIDIIDALNV